MIRELAGPYALQTCFKQMQDSLFYQTEVIQRPNEVRNWNEYALRVNQETSWQFSNGEEHDMINTFNNDGAHISIKWLIQQVTQRGLDVRHLLRVRHAATGTVHYLVVLPDGRYICNCGMPSNLGIPCRHYFRIWLDVEGLPFHISLIRPRWHQNPSNSTGAIAAVCRTHQLQPDEFRFQATVISSAFASNPLDTTSHSATPAPRTQTIPAREVFHNVQTAIRPLLAGVQTAEQVEDLVQSLADL
ncbi:hypothetical protein R3P38DRAFT_2666811, partial [Favolaschia claudopus]